MPICPSSSYKAWKTPRKEYKCLPLAEASSQHQIFHKCHCSHLLRREWQKILREGSDHQALLPPPPETYLNNVNSYKNLDGSVPWNAPGDLGFCNSFFSRVDIEGALQKTRFKEQAWYKWEYLRKDWSHQLYLPARKSEPFPHVVQTPCAYGDSPSQRFSHVHMALSIPACNLGCRLSYQCQYQIWAPLVTLHSQR